MPRFEDLWFDAINLQFLYLIDIEIIDQSDEAWISFSNGIENLHFLKCLWIFATFDDIPEILFDKLPVSLRFLYFTNNNLTKIPESINRLKNLRKLELFNNPNLAEIPWKHLPKSIEYFDLTNTGIERIPEDIKLLTSLRTLKVAKTTLTSIPWACLNPNIEILEMSNVENLHSFKNYTFPKLEKLKISETAYGIHIDLSIFPRTLPSLYIRNNLIEEIRFNPDFECLTSLDLSNNNLTDFPWHDIVRPMKSINLSHNNLHTLGDPRYWVKIEELNLEDNKISKFQMESNYNEGYNDDLLPVELNLSKNTLSSLPYGFENVVQVMNLNISENEFKFENIESMNELLWKRLPLKINRLDVSHNSLTTLPCVLHTRETLSDITAVGCELKYICPRITQFLIADDHLYLDFQKNPSLKTVPFAPVKTLPFPRKQVKQTIEKIIHKPRHHSNFPTTSIFSSSSFVSTQRTPEKNVVLKFNLAKNIENEALFCSCCARCGDVTDDPIVEQIMTMDYDYYEEISEQSYNFWEAGKWKSNLITRFCGDCIAFYRKSAKELNLKRKQDFIEESAKKQNVGTCDDESANLHSDELVIHQSNAEPIACSSQTMPMFENIAFYGTDSDTEDIQYPIYDMPNVPDQYPSILPNINSTFSGTLSQSSNLLSFESHPYPGYNVEPQKQAANAEFEYSILPLQQNDIPQAEYFSVPLEVLRNVPVVPMNLPIEEVQNELIPHHPEHYYPTQQPPHETQEQAYSNFVAINNFDESNYHNNDIPQHNIQMPMEMDQSFSNFNQSKNDISQTNSTVTENEYKFQQL